MHHTNLNKKKHLISVIEGFSTLLAQVPTDIKSGDPPKSSSQQNFVGQQRIHQVLSGLPQYRNTKNTFIQPIQNIT